MSDFAVTAMGPDRAGLIATLAEVVHERGANVHDATMTALSGHVAIVLQVATDEPPSDLGDALRAVTADLDLTIGIRPVIATTPPPPPSHLLSVYGTDRPGLLARITRVLADADASVVDLTSRLLDDDVPPTWAMSIEVLADNDDAALAQHLIDACNELDVDHQFRRIDADTD